jgi:hypothetical protein
MFGISELHRRNASPEHICCASALKAKLEVDESAEIEAAKASARLTLRTALVKNAVIVGSHWHRGAGPLFDGPIMRGSSGADCDGHHSRIRAYFSSANRVVLGSR